MNSETPNPNYINLPTSLHKMILEYGWIATGIVDQNHTYTVGFTDLFDHPEIAINGLPSHIAYHFLVDLHQKLKAGEKFIPGVRYTEIAKGFPVEFIEVSLLNIPDWFGIAARVYDADTKVLQMVWTDTQGKFPWEDGFEKRFWGKQLLFNDRVAYPETTGTGCCDSRCASHNEQAH